MDLIFGMDGDLDCEWGLGRLVRVGLEESERENILLSFSVFFEY